MEPTRPAGEQLIFLYILLKQTFLPARNPARICGRPCGDETYRWHALVSQNCFGAGDPR